MLAFRACFPQVSQRTPTSMACACTHHRCGSGPAVEVTNFVNKDHEDSIPEVDPEIM